MQLVEPLCLAAHASVTVKLKGVGLQKFILCPYLTFTFNPVLKGQGLSLSLITMCVQVRAIPSMGEAKPPPPPLVGPWVLSPTGGLRLYCELNLALSEHASMQSTIFACLSLI